MANQTIPLYRIISPSSTKQEFATSGVTRMVINDSGNLGIGTTAPSEKLHVDGIVASQNSGQGTGLLQLQGYGNSAYINHTGNSNLFFRMGSSFATRMTLTSTGNLGIGTTSPDQNLTVRAANAKISAQSTADSQVIGFQARYQNHATLYGSFEYHTADAQLYIDNNFQGNNGVYSNIRFRNCPNASNTLTDRMIIQGSTGNVGIGTTSPAETLTVSGTGAVSGKFAVMSTAVHNSYDFYNNGTFYNNGAAVIDDSLNITGGNAQLIVQGSNGNITLANSGNNITFSRNSDNYIDAQTGTSSNIIINPQNRFVVNTSDTERMRIDSSGNLLVGTTSTSTYDDNSGTSAHLSNSASNPHTLLRQTASTASSVLLLNDTGSGGAILEFRVDGTAIGTIGNIGTDNLFISGSTANHAGLNFGTNDYIPMAAGANTDNVVSIGSANHQFKDLYLASNIYHSGNLTADVSGDISLE